MINYLTMNIDLVCVSQETNKEHYKLIKDTCKANGWGIEKGNFFIVGSSLYGEIVKRLLLSISGRAGDEVLHMYLMQLSMWYSASYNLTVLSFN